MSKLRLTVSRLLALGGLTAVSGSSYALYRYSLLGDSPVAECRRPSDFSTTKDDLAAEKIKWDDDWDRRKPKFKKEIPVEPTVPVLENNGVTSELSPSVKPQSTATRHVILVRHGQYISNATNAEDKILTEIGRQQALATGERLKSLNVKFDKLTVSTMTRALETANLIHESFPDLPMTKCSLLREGAPYPPEPSTNTWKPKRWEFYADFPRIEGAFRKYIHRADPSQIDDSHELIVCHGNVIRYIVCRALQFPPEGWLRMSVGNCGVTWLTIRPNGRVSLRGLGDTGHLPPDLVTYN